TTTALATTILASAIARRADSLPTRIVYGNGLTETRAYSLKGELVDQLLGGETGSYLYDPGSNLVAARIPGVSSGSLYAYDPLDRLTGETSFRIGQLGYSYDANGNRLILTDDNETRSYAYSPNTNRLTQIENQDITLDAAGNTTASGKWTFEYGPSGRLFKVYRNGKWVATYAYNAQGQRTQKQTRHGTTVYHYDLDGHLIAETGQGGELQRAYVWLDDLPLAQIDSNAKGHDKEHDKGKKTKPAKETIAWLHTDHLGTPRIATDASRQVVWRWDSDAFGAKRPDAREDAHEDDDGHDDEYKLTVDLRFPGQYFDRETKLHYNYFRDYDPSIGRYIESDPIGLAGGLNGYGYGYGYANQNPLKYTDPMGLMGGLAPPYRNPNGPFGPVCGSGSSASWIPDGPWKGACQKHDDCYSKCGASRLQCDIDFLSDSGNPAYFVGVLTGGRRSFEEAQKECSCSQGK
ncbi:MAG: RHS domain-containing protein, partial [Gallionella sp.]|nr:RHS domain-containing protein [Gallionella sp.]